MLAAAAAVAAMASGTAVAAPRPALFRAGAAARSINPTVPVYSGGFSLSPPIKRLHDPLQVRAFYVSNRRAALAFATIDAQGYFSGYNEGADFGAVADRIAAANAASAAGGVRMSQADVIVQATHTHAGPTLEGIWGPVPVSYLKLVHDQVVSAIAAAARSARPAHLQFATLNDPNIAGVNINQDNYQGWVNDTQLSILRAVSARTDATIGVFASVPVHGAHVCGQCLGTLSADYFGAVRAQLDRQLGGVSVVGPATLGRLESPVETTGLGNMEWISGVIANDLLEALAHARWITTTQLDAHESTLRFTATNAPLLALNDEWSLPDAQKQQQAAVTGIYPIDRADRAPFRSGNTFGTWLTAFRIGTTAFVSMPGEPFPEIRLTLAKATAAKTVVALSKGQDDFGYFFPAFDAPYPELYNSDHAVFNVSPSLGDQIIGAQEALLGAIGFPTRSLAASPLANDYAQKQLPGLQTLASPPTGDAGRSGKFTTALQAIYMPAAVIDAPLSGPVHWDFGDGSQADTGHLQVGQDHGQTGQGPHGKPVLFTHSFRPGTYRVRATGTDTNGNRVSWAIIVRVFPRLKVAVSCSGRRPRVAIRGGEGTLLRRSVGVSGGRAFASVLDAAGGTASGRARCG
jgi:hypothetical protein